MASATVAQNYSLEDDDDDELVAPVVMEEGFHNFIVIDNLPVVPEDKRERLLTFVQKVLSKTVGEVKEITMPFDEQNKTTKGFAFVEFTKPDKAAEAVQKLNGYKLDIKHTLKVNKFSDLEKLDKVPDEYKEPEAPEFVKTELLYDFLVNPSGHDQYLIMSDAVGNADIFQFVGGDKNHLFSRKDFTERYFAWSPRGTYLAAFHSKGITIHGGPDFVRVKAFNHPGVERIEFSPCENYLVTYSSHPIDSEDNHFVFWDVRTGQMKRKFGLIPGQKSVWPEFLWSHDDKYFARINKGAVSVYDSSTFRLLDDRSLIFNAAVKDFCWSPGANILACWIPESGSIPARVVLVRIPDRKEIAQKNLFNVSKCGFRWQSQGDYLCVMVERQKSKKQTVTTFEIFRMREKDIPVEVLELDQWVGRFYWEPKGKRFAILHAEQPAPPRPNVSFYEVGPKKIQHISTLEKRQVNEVFWSPAGRFAVLASLGSMSGTLEFYNVQDKETMGTGEHELLTWLQWDPTGRYVATYVSQWDEKLENGYMIWSFQGHKLLHEARGKFYQFIWRPRPPSPLTKEDEKAIQKEWKSITEKYTKEDEEKQSEVKKAKQERKQKMRTEYDQIIANRLKELEKEPPKRPNSGDIITVEETVEEVVEVTEELIE